MLESKGDPVLGSPQLCAKKWAGSSEGKKRNNEAVAWFVSVLWAWKEIGFINVNSAHNFLRWQSLSMGGKLWFWRFLFFLHQTSLLNLRSKTQASAQKVPLFPWGSMEAREERGQMQWFIWAVMGHISTAAPSLGIGGTEGGKRHGLDLLSHF